MKILVPTDAFPPVCGGSGWSTYELARGLRARGHEVTLVQPRPGTASGERERDYDGFRILELGAPAPDIPFVRNYFKSEKLTRSLAGYLEALLQKDRYDIVHAQHVMTTMAAIEAAHTAHVPAVATVRDYWPVCYWSDLLHTREARGARREAGSGRAEGGGATRELRHGESLCPACTSSNMVTCIQPRAGALWPLALPMIPYMRANLASKRLGLARADAVIAVSRCIARDLVERAPELARTRLEVIPNPVDVAALRALARCEARGARRGETAELTEAFALYLGKLAPNKGTSSLVEVVRQADLDWPLVIVGDGPDRPALERAAKDSGRRIEFKGWLGKDEATRLLASASMLIFTSRGPESLSRVLLEASALGIPIAAMDTGGTRDIVEHDITGLLSNSPEGLAADVRRLRQDPALRQRLGDAAKRKIETEFDAAAVVARIEQLYQELANR